MNIRIYGFTDIHRATMYANTKISTLEEYRASYFHGEMV